MSNSTLTHYELVQLRKLRKWQQNIMKPQGGISQFSKKIQNKFNSLIPQKIHDGITKIMRKMVEVVLFTSEFVKPPSHENMALEMRETSITNRMEYYRTTAAAEGGVTGFGGIVGSLADFPLLLTIKLKFLFDVASIYGYDTTKISERIYLLHVFQLAFSSPVRQADTYSHLSVWAAMPHTIPTDPNTFDWYQFQQDYRDYLDVAKLLQMLPVVGAGVGVVVNYRLLNRLSNTAIMCYRMRWLSDKEQLRNKVTAPS